MRESREEVQKRLDKRWEDFKVEITEMVRKFDNNIFQFYQILDELKTAVNPHNLPYGYGDKRD